MIKRILCSLKESIMAKRVFHFCECVSIFLYVFSIPSFSGRYPYNYVSYALMALLIMLTFVNMFLFGKFVFRPHLLFMPVFALWAFIGTAVYSHEFRRWLTLVLMCVTMMVLYYSFIFLNNHRLALKLVVFAFLGFSVYFLFIYRNEFLSLAFLKGQSRLGWFFDNVNQVGSYMAIATSLSLLLGLFPQRKRELLYLFPIVIFGTIGISTGSKQFVFLTLFSILIIIFVRFKRRKWLFLIAAVLLTGLFVSIINLPFAGEMKSRLIRLFSFFSGEGGDTSTMERFLWQQYAVYLGYKNLFFGYGADGFSVASSVGTYSHGNAAEVLCDFGAVGFAIFHGCIIYLAYRSIRKKNDISKANFVFVAYLLVASFTTVFYYEKDFYLILSIMYFLIDSCSDDARYQPFFINTSRFKSIETVIRI